MSGIRRLLRTRLGSNLRISTVIQSVLTGTGVFTFIAGVLYLPTLGPTQVEAILGLMLLAILALACTAVGQLTRVVELLEARSQTRQ